MSFLSTIENFFQVAEADVMTVILKVETGVKVLESDIQKAWTWISAHAGEISSDAAMVANGIATLQGAGIPIPSIVNSAVSQMTTAVNILNAAVGASNAGAGFAGVVAAGYTAAKTAQASVATAAAAVTAAAKTVQVNQQTGTSP